MNRKTMLFSPSVCTSMLFLPSVWLHAASLRAPNSQQSLPGSPMPDMSGSAEDIRDIYGPVLLPEPPPYLLYGIGVLLLILLLLALWLTWRYMRQRKTTAKIDPALAALASLKKAESGLAQSGIFFFAVEVSRILRHYIEAQFNLPAPRCTTTEFFSRLETSSESQLSLKEDDTTLKQCLILCDKIKFSRFHPEHEAVKSLAHNVRSFIEATRTKPAEEK